MKRVRQIGVIIFLSLLSFNVLAQNCEINRLSFSISWTPEYWGPNDGKLRLDAINPITFESLVNYRPFSKVSFSSGVGYERHVSEMQSWIELSVIDLDKSYRWVINEIRIPVQAHYHFSEGVGKTDTYIKAEFRNKFSFSEMNYYDLGELVNSRSNSWYSSSIGLGVGSILRANKSIGILIEGSLGTILDKDILFQMYIVKLKLGIVLK